MRRVNEVLLLTLALISAAGACRPKHHADVEPDADITLRVVNHNWLDVTIYVVHDGERTRVGLVTASSTQSFSLSGRLLGQSHQLQLLGDPIGSRDGARTDVLTVQPGQLIEWTLESDLGRSTIGIY